MQSPCGGDRRCPGGGGERRLSSCLSQLAPPHRISVLPLITWVGVGVTGVAQVSLSEDRVPSGSRKVDHSLGGPWSHLRPSSSQVYSNILMSLLPTEAAATWPVCHTGRGVVMTPLRPSLKCHHQPSRWVLQTAPSPRSPSLEAAVRSALGGGGHLFCVFSARPESGQSPGHLWNE